jgi:hypothetical protein
MLCASPCSKRDKADDAVVLTYLRRYRLRESAIEIFFIPTGGSSYGGYGLFAPSSSLFLDFGAGARELTRRHGSSGPIGVSNSYTICK